MEISDHTMLLEAAKSGNFAAFCVFSMLEGTDLENISDFEEFYENIRKNLPECEKTQNSDWFSLQEFFDFYNFHQNSSEPLFEVASAQARIRMRRAAKRTSKIRARKRAIRERFRKNKTQLAKRAYNQVKTELRKRLTGGKPWSSVSLSTRQRIDSMISKRRPLMKRLVNQRIQKMPGQESQRLKAYAMRMREDFDWLNDYLPESNKDPTGTERKRRFDRRNREDPARFLNRVRLVRSKKTGKRMLVDRDSVNNSHIVEAKQSAPSGGEIDSVCKDIQRGGENTEQTPTSTEICGPAAKQIKPPKTQTSKNNSSTSTPENKLPAPNTEQEIPEMPIKEYASAARRESTTATLFNIQQENPDDYALLQTQMGIYFENLSALQNSDSSDQNITEQNAVRNSRKEATRIFDKHKIDEKVYSDFFDYSKEFAAAANTAVALKELPDLKDKVLISLGTMGGKTDLLAVSRNLGNSESITKELLGLLESGEKNHKTNTNRLNEILNQSIRISQKTGSSQLMSGSVSTDETDGLRLFAYAMAGSEISQDTTKKIEKFSETAKQSVTEVRTGGTEAEIKRNGSQEDKDKLAQIRDTKRSLNELLHDIVNDPDVVKRMLRGALTGVHRFGEDSPFGRIAIATHFLATDRDGSDVKFTEISDDFVEGLAATKNKYYVAIKSASQETEEEAQNTRKYEELLQSYVSSKQNDETSDPKNISLEFLKRVYSIYEKVTEHAKTERPDTWKTLSYGELVAGYLNSQSDVFSQYDDIDKAILSKAIAPTTKARHMWLALRITMLKAKAKKSPPEKKKTSTTEEKNFRFSHNPLIQMLLEINEILPNTIEAKQKNETEELAEHERKIYEILFEYAGTDLNKIMQVLDVSIDRISMDPIDPLLYIPSRGDGRYNSIYVDGKYHQVPLIVSERYREIGKAFLQENKKRNYRSEYDNYHSQPEQIKRRSARNMARRWAERKGLVRKGDGKDIDHKNSDPTDNSPKNLRVRDRSKNRADNE